MYAGIVIVLFLAVAVNVLFGLLLRGRSMRVSL
jgi:hypothetical protein